MAELKSFYRIYADVRNSKGSIVAAKMKQNDTKTRYLDITVTDNGVPVDLTDCEVRIYGRKYDKTEFYNDGIIRGATMGRCLFEATTQMLAYPEQNVNCEVVVFKDNVQILSTMPFDIFVVETLMGDSSIESSNEYGALVVLFQNLYESYDLMTRMVQNIGAPGMIAEALKLNTMWEAWEYMSDYISGYLTDKINEAIANSSVQGVLDLIGKATDTGENDTVFGKMNAISPVKSIQSVRFAIGSHGGNVTNTVNTVNKDKTVILLQRLMDQSSGFTKIDYSFDGTTLNVKTSNDASSKNTSMLEFWFIEFY